MKDGGDLKQEVFGGGIARRILPAVYALRHKIRRVMGKQFRILVGIKWRLGDEVMALPIYKALAEQYPGSEIAAWCNYPDLLIDNPYVSKINPPDFVFDRFVDLREAPRMICRPEIYAKLAGVDTQLERPRLYCENWASRHLDGLLTLGKPLIALAPGASWPTKRWPLQNWRALAEKLIADGCTVVELGNDDDPEIGMGISLRGMTSVRDAACILHSSRLLISCDSGLMHLALAAGTPVIALFGPTDPAILVRDEPLLTPLTNQRYCKGCWNTRIMRKKGICPAGIEECLEPIAPDLVLKHVRSIIHGGC